MPIISMLEDDQSNTVCKVYAEQTLDLLTKGKAADQAAEVPLANIFRLLEMYRYDAFEDERRSGVLALAELGKPSAHRSQPWYTEIKCALDKAVQAVFKNQTRETAVEELQDVLQKLAAAQLGAGTVDIEKHRQFYRELSAALPA